MTMRFSFRVDASLQIGSGHLMRCLTLAEALRANGAHCHFISRVHSGHLLELVRQRGFKLSALPATSSIVCPPDLQEVHFYKEPAHSQWLGCDWETDAEQTRVILKDTDPDWLVVDHYALDKRWEENLNPHYQKLMVIDDLADRPHHCDLLLDQSLGRAKEDYAELVPSTSTLLVGPQYALLRPEFAALRSYSLQRRQPPILKNLLVTMGGVDKQNATAQVLETLKVCRLSEDCRITVVMGLQAPWLPMVQSLAKDLPWSADVLVNIDDIAQRMADSDLAIGAAGTTSWERCCLGLPTFITVLAENQKESASALQQAQAAHLLGEVSDIETRLPLAISELLSKQTQLNMSTAAASLTDGLGVDRVINAIEVLHV